MAGVGLLYFDDTTKNAAPLIDLGTLNWIDAKKELSASLIRAGEIGTIEAAEVDITKTIYSYTTIGKISVKGDIRALWIIASESIGSIMTGGSLSTNVKSKLGNIGPIDVGSAGLGVGSFLGCVQADDGNIGSIKVGGSFETSKFNPPKRNSLVYATGSVGNITVGSNLGRMGAFAGTDAIEGKSFGDITVKGDINLTNITATDGSIGKIKGTEEWATIRAIGGNIGPILVTSFKDNIRITAEAKISPILQTTVGGYIVSVTSIKLIPDNVTIRADYYLGKVVVSDPNAAEVCRIIAQSGAEFDPLTNTYVSQAALLIEVGNGAKFAGYLDMHPQKANLRYTVAYYPDDVALTVKDGAAATDWVMAALNSQENYNYIVKLYYDLDKGVLGFSLSRCCSMVGLSLVNGDVTTAMATTNMHQF